jgi:type I restriction enzyme R subunit
MPLLLYRLTIKESHPLIVGVLDYRYLNPFVGVSQTEANLPHWRQDRVTYFVTFRLADSVPQSKLSVWKSERDRWLSENPKPHDDRQNAEYYDLFSARIEKWLDAGEGACILKEFSGRRFVEEALRYFDGERYELGEYVVAANHVHVLVSPNAAYCSSDIIHSWKSYSANQINRAVGHSGVLWQKEYYDHILRSAHAAYCIEQYIRRHVEYSNPM